MLLEEYLRSQLDKRMTVGNLRKVSHVEGLIDFASNDYLGFAKDRYLLEAIVESWRGIPKIGSGGSRLLTGHHTFIEELETMIACFHQSEAGLLFNSGYMANVGLISAVVKEDDICLYDAHVHASMHEGMRLTKTECLPWRHNDLHHLESRLRMPRKGRVFVIVESIYSTDGSQVGLKKVSELCDRFNAHLIVDEAHATGVIGLNGKGLVCQEQCQDKVFARIHTFSKALGVFGAIVLGSNALKDFLVNFSRPFIYSTALPWPVLIGIKEAYLKLMHAQEVILRLHEVIKYFKQSAHRLGLPIWPSNAPIQFLEVSGNQKVSQASASLAEAGFEVRALMSPTVQRGKERLRICLHAFNTENEIDALVNALAFVA